jgi:hypothetical protein
MKEEHLWRFTEELRPTIRGYVKPLKFPTFSSVVEAAMTYEETNLAARDTDSGWKRPYQPEYS